MPGPAVLILAAGASSRMGGADKLMETIDDAPLLRRVCVSALGSGWPVLVTLPEPPLPRLAALSGLPVAPLTVPYAAEGMAASIRAGVRACGRAAALMVCPADMPELEPADFAALAQAWAAGPPDRILRAATQGGRPGQPVVLPRRLFPALAELKGDTGARDLLRQQEVHLHPLPGNRAAVDLDTPAAWAAWRAARAVSSGG